jgi:hypothetical protein
MLRLDYRDGRDDVDRRFAALVKGVYWLSAGVLVLVILLLAGVLIVEVDLQTAARDPGAVLAFCGLLALTAVVLEINVRVLKRHHRGTPPRDSGRA